MNLNARDLRALPGVAAAAVAATVIPAQTADDTGAPTRCAR